MKTYPNQKIIHINKETHKNAYLSIEIDEWIDASNNLKPITFKIYLYLASNADGFDLALSRQDIMDKLSISKNSYLNGIAELEEKNYIILKQGNIYDFYTVPMYQSSGTSDIGIYHSSGTVCTNPVVHDVPVQCTSMYQSSGTEISKTATTATLSNKVANAPNVANATEERKRTLKDLSKEELKELANDYRGEIKYPVLYEKYNLCKGELNKELLSNIDSILSERDKEEKYSSIKDNLDDGMKKELMKLINVNEEELLEYLSAIEVTFLPEELVVFLEENEMFTYKEWVKNYQWQEFYRDKTYFEWFTEGVNLNLHNNWDY
jgi:hypothetical protein